MGESKIVHCYHCDQEMRGHVPFYATIDGKEQPMCCAGCKAVAEMIVNSGFTKYYDHREACAIRPDSIGEIIPEELRQEMHFYDHPDIARQFVTQKSETEYEAYLIVDNIVCAACVWLLEQAINRVPGVHRFDVNYTTHRAHLSFNPQEINISEILLEVVRLGYKATPFDEQEQQRQLKEEWRSLLKAFGVAALFSMQVMTLTVALYFGAAEGSEMSDFSKQALRWASLVATIPCVTYSSWVFYKSAYYDLKNKRLSMNVNVSLALIFGTLWSAWNTVFGIGETYYESVSMFAFLLLGARVLETNSRHKALLISDHILKLTPNLAERINPDGSTEHVATNKVNIGDKLLIRPGESIPLDGILLDEIAMVDESLLTGESLPIEKHKGDQLIGGSVNYEQALTIEVTNIGADTVLSQMSRLIDRSMSEKPRIAMLADIISTWFVLGLIMACLGTFAVWYYIADPTQAFAVTLAVLVVSCPCALALATPSALSIGNQAIIEKGLIATRAGALETLGKITDIVFDKTGTLTEGKLTVNRVELFNPDITEEQVKKIAVSLEATSSHPIAHGFQQLGYEESIESYPVENLENIVGKGVKGVIDGVEYRIGRLDWFPNSEYEAVIDDNLWIGLGVGDKLYAAFSLHDRLKSDAEEVVNRLKAENYNLHILSGDRSETVAKFNEKLEIPIAKGDLSPEDKLAYVEQLQANGAIVSMLGDGINDGPVLGKADVSIAIGQGALIAQSTADMILMKDQKLKPLVEGITLAKRTDRIIVQNLTWALAYNIIAIPVAMLGYLEPWMAALGMSLSSVLVVVNTVRIRDHREEKER